MALTNPRPFQIPTSTTDNEILLNTTSPVFQASALGLSTKPDPITATAADVFPNMSSSSPSELSSNPKSKKDNKKDKDVPAVEISKLIPVTGDRPIPSDRSAPLDDEVLFTVFIILWEKDPDQQGMTVKQLCDYLLEKNPDMSNLSTKLSNLISAKLNAYVKKLEKGEKTLIYALSREWSDSSPRRMLYVYRGILSPDYKEHAQAASVQLKQQQMGQQINSQKGNGGSSDNSQNDKFLNDSFSFSKKVGMSNNLAFTLGNEFNIPYSTSPVSASLTPTAPANVPSPGNASVKSNSNNQKKRTGASDSNDVKSDSSKNGTKKVKPNPTKVPGSEQAPTVSPPVVYITAAAAAPRLSKASKDSFKNTSQNSAGILSALHKIISTQTPIESQFKRDQSNSSTDPLVNSQYDSSPIIPSAWMKTVRNGFLTEDIESPESITLDDLDSIFN
ncbi:hypothetical protein Kpol_367p3 [Vanderwaltozyma polyspora DSM 70294]|uniref:GDS1 winged helix domain-containing protein n=1 Tax=Vanderwaltozyma polyspora (strain ATCC 22028 / DSM 70294 / BCRC 21397 / CBS 2163 / NBRC 10782 / NRRL Y-8283 / UCD 57-17) TaxID=436907 RepID=A7TRQ4_VANPO|nr:uncharacterized protein Kpol_367p3 [Vanderwaltozyma polyspora DSM 70294]EDO15048.1 hypothetical protein Kpol_367p3 [Vanderwaltozyma polyspora DSM 70294]